MDEQEPPSQSKSQKRSKTILFIGFTFLVLLSLSLSISVVYTTGFEEDFEKSAVNYGRMIWFFKGPVFVFLYSIISLIGIRKLSKSSFIFGYAVSIGIIVSFILDSLVFNFGVGAPFALVDFLVLIGIVLVPSLVIFHLRKLQPNVKINMPGYLLIIVLAGLLCNAFLE